MAIYWNYFLSYLFHRCNIMYTTLWMHHNRKKSRIMYILPCVASRPFLYSRHTGTERKHHRIVRAFVVKDIKSC